MYSVSKMDRLGRLFGAGFGRLGVAAALMVALATGLVVAHSASAQAAVRAPTQPVVSVDTASAVIGETVTFSWWSVSSPYGFGIQFYETVTGPRSSDWIMTDSTSLEFQTTGSDPGEYCMIVTGDVAQGVVQFPAKISDPPACVVLSEGRSGVVLDTPVVRASPTTGVVVGSTVSVQWDRVPFAATHNFWASGPAPDFQGLGAVTSTEWTPTAPGSYCLQVQALPVEGLDYPSARSSCVPVEVAPLTQATFEWDSAPVCSTDGTSMMTASVRNDSSARATYKVRLAGTNHTSAAVRINPGRSADVTLGGLRPGTQTLEILANNNPLTPRKTITVSTCVPTTFEWDSAPVCSTDGTSMMTASVRNNSSARATYKVRLAGTNHTSAAVRINPGRSADVTLGGLRPGTQTLEILANNKQLVPTKSITVAECSEDISRCFNNAGSLSPLSSAVHRAALGTSGSSVSDERMLSGCNRVPFGGIYLGGPSIFAGVRDMVSQAKHEVILQFFVFEIGSSGVEEIGWGLAEAANNLPVGERLTVRLVAGSSVNRNELFAEPGWSSIDRSKIDYWFAGRGSSEIAGPLGLFNDVMHDKVVIVDGKSTIVTGANPQKQQQGHGAWYDIGVLIEGPHALSALENFEDVWESDQNVVHCVSVPEICDLEYVNRSETPWNVAQAGIEGSTSVVALPRVDSIPILAMDDTNNPQDRAWEAVFASAPAYSTISVLSPNINDNNFIDGVVEASMRGVNVEVMTSFGFNASRQDYPFQGGRNCKAVSKILERANPNRLTIKWHSWDGNRPVEGGGDYASHAKFMAVSDYLGRGILSIVGSGNQDTQSWDSSHEYNVMLDGRDVTDRLMEEAFEPVWEKGIIATGDDCPD